MLSLTSDALTNPKSKCIYIIKHQLYTSMTLKKAIQPHLIYYLFICSIKTNMNSLL